MLTRVATPISYIKTFNSNDKKLIMTVPDADYVSKSALNKVASFGGGIH